MCKKLSVADRTRFSIIETGGVRLRFNTGTYELFKTASDEFYNSQKFQDHRKKTTVLDNNGAVVETKFKITGNRMSHYTLNMYHTTSICLINGKNTKHFYKMI